jgi:hypothetical protein
MDGCCVEGREGGQQDWATMYELIGEIKSDEHGTHSGITHPT